MNRLSTSVFLLASLMLVGQSSCIPQRMAYYWPTQQHQEPLLMAPSSPVVPYSRVKSQFRPTSAAKLQTVAPVMLSTATTTTTTTTQAPAVLSIEPRTGAAHQHPQADADNVTLTNSTFRSEESLPNAITKPAGFGSSPDINYYVSTSVALLGAALGREGCDLKAACLAGNLLLPVKGKDVVVMAAEAFVPEPWKPVYQAAKSSMLKGEDCAQFNCF